MAVETNDKKLSDLLRWVEEGNAQLPDTWGGPHDQEHDRLPCLNR